MNIQLTQLFQLLCDETRLRSLFLIKQEGELCVCELVHALGLIQPKISRHLATLRDAGVVLDRRQGQWIYYRLNPDLPDWAAAVLETMALEAANSTPFSDDLALLKQMPNRPNTAFCA
jgi:ArsR family transcriptional regulator